MPSPTAGTPLVSVLVPCFRSARFLERSVRSALAQTMADLEVVVVDNASDDATWAVAERLAAEDPRVRIHRNDANLGPVRNWRRCAELARGRFAALLFSDDWYQPEFLAEALAPLQQDPGVGFTYSAVRIVFEDAELRPSGERLSYRLDGPAVRPTSEFLAELLERGMQGVPVSPGCALLRREDLAAWLAHELPDPHQAGYLAHGAGPDLWVYLQGCQAYPRFGHLQAPRVSFAAHPDNLTWKPGIQAAYALSRLEFLLSRRPPSIDLQAALAHCWLSLERDPRREVVAPHLGLGAWLQLGASQRQAAHDAGRRGEVEAIAAEDAAVEPRAIPGLPPAVFEPVPPIPPGSPYAVTAIVSAYQATRFLRGCLEDLLAQTLHASGRLEIVVVDTGSPEDEGAIVREFLPRSPHLRYLRSEDRRTLYAAWNLGVLAARGRYLTNANADDRHRPDALERLAAALDAAPEVGLVYADSLVSTVANDTFATATSRRRMAWGPFSYPALRRQCFMGPHPMWRRELHERFGLFDAAFSSAGDWEFWVRVGRAVRMEKVDDCLGLYYLNPQGLEHGSDRAGAEAGLVRRRYGIAPWEAALGPDQVRFDAWDPARAERPDRPLVSVVITAPRAGDLLAKAFAGVAMQTCPDVELVLVEAMAGEGAELLRQVRRHRPGLRHRVVRARGGHLSALNAGVAAADGRFIVPLGERDFLEPEYLERTLAALAAEPSAGLAFSDDQRAGAVHENGPWEGAALARREAAASTALYHRHVFAALGPFRDGQGGSPERDLWRRAVERGIQGVRVPLPLYHSAAPAPRPFTARVAFSSPRST
jgi:glycosyltransferase involved in cell wall biosynthesis